LDTRDLEQLLDEVQRFARERIAALTARPESPIDIAVLDQLTNEAGDLGILPLSTSDDGFSIWEHCADACDMAFNTGALRRIAYANAGVAFAWHRLGLTHFLATQLGLALDANKMRGTLLAPTGHYGLARSSLARWLRGAELQDEDKELLTDWLDRRTNTTTIYGRPDWTCLLWPVWHSDQIVWQQIERSDLGVGEERAQHGLDELSCFVIRQQATSDKIIDTTAEQSHVIYGCLLKMEMLGLLAIGAGVLDRGQELAHDYSEVRKQGGQVIGRHPAVQHMLSDIVIARHNVSMALAAFEQPLDTLDVGAVAASRASLSGELCKAANQVVQIYGGIGYMRDAGPEKLLRDQNMLKLMSGGARELHNFLAGCSGGRP
jgi:alkylation response protein AidB-like acyl-CoA dehydrogenase